MPALPAVPQTLKVRMGMTVGTDTTTGWHLFLNYGPATPTAGNLNSLASSISANYTTSLQPHASTAVTLTSVTVQDLASSSTPLGVWAGTLAGTQVGPLSASVSMLISFKIGRRYRGGHPRVYIPTGYQAVLNNPQQWTSAFRSTYETAFNAFVSSTIANMGTWAAGPSHVTVSYYLNGEWKQDQNGNYHRVPKVRPTPLVDVVSSRTAGLTIASQRRRIRPV